ncbi:MAG: AAA family ATPase, partial [Oscillospiraceae bacterium]
MPMKLKAIDVSGFKSFADKIKLNFDDGITAVVGPNGSGKSNIADAIRWVLGEQSVKTLRGGKMEDIIFNGTATRKAQGMASVSLLIDNCDHSLGIDAAEVAITRKLYRSGESEYRINENQVRLKDINELFMDTGIGRDGYAIIGQGKVSEIVSARSKERREIFEEAAGISKFRYRKSEAEKQLLQSEENLNRLKDILAEIETRVGPLRLQSEKARKFLALSEEKKALEISISVHNLKGLNLRKGEIEDKLILAQQQLDEFQSEADLSEEEYESCQAVGRALNIEIDDLRRELENATLDISQKQSRIAVLNNDIQHFSASEKDVKDSFNKTNISKEENIITR